MQKFSLRVLLGTTALILATVPLSLADTIDIGVGSPPTTVAFNNGSTILVTAVSSGGFTGSVTASGSPLLTEPTLISDTLDVNSSGAGTLVISVTETGLTTVVPGFLSGFTSNTLPLGWTVSEATYVDAGNTAYATTTPLSAQTFSVIGATTAIAAGISTGPFSETEVFTVTATDAGQTQDTISLMATPEPTSMALLGSGLLALGGTLRRKLVF